MPLSFEKNFAEKTVASAMAALPRIEEAGPDLMVDL